jgi:hypothetical protein
VSCVIYMYLRNSALVGGGGDKELSLTNVHLRTS